MDDFGVRNIAAAVIKQAVEDLDVLYLKINKIHEHCQGGHEALTNHLMKRCGRGLYVNSKMSFIPFNNPEDYNLIKFFKPDHEWGRILFDAVDIEELPKEMRDKIHYIKQYAKYCIKCVEFRKRTAIKRVKTNKEAAV